MSEQTFSYANLKQVDPNYTPVDADVYTLRVLKFAIQQTKGENGKEVKPYLSTTFSIVNHANNNGRRLFHTFWNIQDGNGYDAKSLRRVADAVGVINENFEAWVEDMNSTQPEFKVPVNQRQATKWNPGTQTRDPLFNADGTPQMENVIDFRNVAIAG